MQSAFRLRVLVKLKELCQWRFNKVLQVLLHPISHSADKLFLSQGALMINALGLGVTQSAHSAAVNH